MKARIVRKLTVLSRDYCHLCEDMVAALYELQTRRGDFEFEIVNVESDRSLEERFGERVPVLLFGDREICHYRLDLEALARYFP